MGRPSHVRAAVAELIESSRRHAWTLDDAHTALDSRGVSADPSSVFRALVHMCDTGELQRFDVGDGRARFERRSGHHEHIVCSDCGEIAAVPGCVVDGVIPEVERETGFLVSDHRLTFSGRCGRCAGAG
jgi:Fur family ferric uptake transcriptional regulator